MTVVDENRLKGNFASAYVMSRLSGDCLVRPVAAETDVGVDLYCETVEQGCPFLHFWMQVKSGKQCELGDDGSSASCRFETRHLEYWSRQPVPVFAALVPVDWPVEADPAVYIVDITSRLLQNAWGSAASSKLQSDYTWQPGVRAHVIDFLREVVPTCTARLMCSKGVLGEIPTPRPQYVQRSPLVPVLQFRREIGFQIRRTAARSVEFLYHLGQLNEDPDFRRLMARIVREFQDPSHWENFWAQGLSYHADHEFERAVEMYDEAKAVIDRDRRVREEQEWIARKDHIEQVAELARRGHDLPPAGPLTPA